MKDTKAKDFNIPVDYIINLDFTYNELNLIMKSLITSGETFKMSSKFMLGKDKEDVLNAIEDFNILYCRLETKLIDIENNLGGKNE